MRRPTIIETNIPMEDANILPGTPLGAQRSGRLLVILPSDRTRWLDKAFPAHSDSALDLLLKELELQCGEGRVHADTGYSRLIMLSSNNTSNHVSR